MNGNFFGFFFLVSNTYHSQDKRTFPEERREEGKGREEKRKINNKCLISDIMCACAPLMPKQRNSAGVRMFNGKSQKNVGFVI